MKDLFFVTEYDACSSEFIGATAFRTQEEAESAIGVVFQKLSYSDVVKATKPRTNYKGDPTEGTYLDGCSLSFGEEFDMRS